MKNVAAALVLCGVLAACTDPGKATEILSENGYSNVYITGYRWFGCSDDDFYHTGFDATSATGKRVAGTVCSGLFFKGSTIRFD